MPVTTASQVASRLATVFDFLPALARRHLAARAGLRGTVQVTATGDGVFTLTHQYRQGCGAELVEVRIAQLRAVGTDPDSYALFWKKCNGRWTAYSQPAATLDSPSFVGSIDECLSEIARDPAGCFWS